MPSFSRFILGFENKTGEQAGQNGRGDAAGCGFQSAGENPKEPILLNGFLDTLGKVVAEACQGNGGACPGEFHKRLIDPDGSQQNTDDDIADKDSCRGQFGLVNQDLSNEAKKSADEICFYIIDITDLL